MTNESELEDACDALDKGNLREQPAAQKLSVDRLSAVMTPPMQQA